MNLKQLAQKIGLSQTTVSRALNDYPEVSEATRGRVAQAAQHYGYRPNMRARSLATGQVMAIGHVIPVGAQNEMVNPVFGDFIAGAAQTYARHGYDMHLSIVPDRDQARIFREMQAKGAVDGLIIQAPREGDARITALREIGLPFVVHGRAPHEDEDSYAWVDVNNRRAFERACAFLLDLGHRRIALINGPDGMDFTLRRRAGAG